MFSVNSRAVKFLLCAIGLPGVLSRAAFATPIQNENSYTNPTADLRVPVLLEGSILPRITSASDVGSASGSEELTGITILFKQTPSQTEALKKLLVEQQMVGSVYYHRWLSTQEYQARYGLDDKSIEAVERWLVSEGFTHATVNASHTAVSFDGNVAQAERSFSTRFHRYEIEGRIVLANSADLEIPADLSHFVEGVINTDEFQPRAHAAHHVSAPHWSSPVNGTHFITPADVERIYHFAPLTAAGYTGKGQSIAVVGQSAVAPDDIARFRIAAGLSARQPQFVLVPHTGSSVRKPGDEYESDVDLEYSGAIAPDADIIFVYTGSDTNHGVFDALAYAVDQNLAPVVTISYGQCERMLPNSKIAALERVLMQAAAQGQSVLASSGDTGAAGCETDPSHGPAVNGLGVQYPASSQYVTSVGGTMFSDAAFSLYWAADTAADGESAQGYIPEQAWNEPRDAGEQLLFGSGGGKSASFPKPSWQVASGVPQDGARDIPDVALAAGAGHDGYLVCSSDSSLHVQGSCSRGFLDAAGQNLIVAGGTSFGAPIWAGIVALLDQSSDTRGLGSLNALLYPLAARISNAFHDITTGTNRQPCSVGSQDCSNSGSEGYSAGPGYDLVTGLGTPDVGRIMAALAPAPGVDEPVSLSLRQIGTPAQPGAVVHILAVVTAFGNAPEGAIQLSLDGESVGSPVSTSDGEAAFTVPMPTAGTHTISAAFTNASGQIAARANLVITIPGQAVPSEVGFLLSSAVGAPNAAGSVSAITVTPSAGYSGKVSFAASTSNSDLAQFGCYLIPDVDVTTAAAAQTILTVARSTSACKKLEALSNVTVRYFSQAHSALLARNGQNSIRPADVQQEKQLEGKLVLFSACGVVFLTNLRKRFRFYSASLLALFSLTISLSGCSVTVVSGQAPPGTYKVLVQGSDTLRPSTAAAVAVSMEIR